MASVDPSIPPPAPMAVERLVPTSAKLSLPPTTTSQEDVVTAGQRRINLIWEVTQSLIGLAVTLAVIYCTITQTLSPELTNSFFLIIGFYYSRTNHQAVGGIGPQSQQKYEGR